jgi:hypothetical protein
MGVLGTDHTIENNDIDVTGDAVGIRFYNSGVPDINGDSGDEVSVANTVLDSNQISSVEFSQSSNLYDGSVTIGSDSYPTIQAAIDAASEGDTIEIKPGQYEEVADNRDAYGTDNSFGLYVGTDDLTIRGVTAAGEPITKSENVQAEIISQTSSSFGTNGVFVAADGVTIEGLEITPNPDSSPNKNIEVAGNDFTLANSVVNGKIGSVYFNTGNVQELSVVGNDINGSLSFNDGAGNETTADNRIVRNNHIGLLSFAGEQEDVAWRNWAVGPVTVEDNTIEGHQYTLRYEENGETKTYVYQGVLSRVGTITEPMDWQSVLADNTVERGVLIPDQSTPTGVKNVGETGSQYEVYYGVQDAIDDAENGDSVVTLPATYNESVTIDSPNVSLEGPNAGTPGDASRGDEAIVEGQININAQNVTIDGLQVTPGVETFNETPAAAIIVFDSNATIQNNKVGDFTVNITEINANSVQGIQIWETVTLAGTTVTNNSVENITYAGSSQAPDGDWSIDYGNLYGIHVQGEIGNAEIADNTLRNLSSDGYTLAMAVSGTDSDPDASPGDIVIRGNTFANLNAKGAPATAFTVSSDRVNASNVSVVANSFDAPVDIANGASETLEAPLNYYGDGDTPNIKGPALYDPLLTDPAEQTSDDLQDIRNYGSYLELETEGEPAVIGFPAPPAEPLGEIISNEMLSVEGEGANTFVYDNTEQSFEEVDGDFVPEAGDVIVITTGGDPISGDLIVPVDTTVEGNAATPSQVEINEGWNLVATGAANSPRDPVVTSDVLQAGQFQTQPTQPGAPSAEVGAYEGTWIFADDDGQLATGYVEDQPPTSYFELVLLPDTENDDS